MLQRNITWRESWFWTVSQPTKDYDISTSPWDFVYSMLYRRWHGKSPFSHSGRLRLLSQPVLSHNYTSSFIPQYGSLWSATVEPTLSARAWCHCSGRADLPCTYASHPWLFHPSDTHMDAWQSLTLGASGESTCESRACRDICAVHQELERKYTTTLNWSVER